MAASKEVMDITDMSAEESAQALTLGYSPEGVRIVAEILKSPCMPRPKKEKHAMIPVLVSLRNPLRTKLTMEEKRKVVNIETNEEEEALEELIIEEDEDEGMKEETKTMYPPTKLAAYIPSWKGKAKVPKDIDESKSSLQTPLLLDNITFEGTHLGWVPSLKFEDWDLVDHEKFPHLETAHLMKPKKNIVVGVTKLEL